MQCTTCQYPLWNIAARTCPECGAPFKPSEHRFIANSVRFCCPHCKQDYYGTSPEGHLEPRSFTCVRCQRAVDEDEMVLLPTAGVREEQTRIDVHPWISRERGIIKDLFGTAWRAMFAPTRLARAMPKDSERLGRAVSYWCLIALPFSIAVGLVISTFMWFVMSAAVAGRAGGAGSAPVPAAMPVFMATPMAGIAIVGPVAAFVLVIVWALLTHACACVIAKPARGVARTLEAFFYGCTPLAVMPLGSCVGVFTVGISVPWAVVASILMLKERQAISGGSATAAVLGSGVLIVLVVVLGFVLFVNFA